MSQPLPSLRPLVTTDPQENGGVVERGGGETTAKRRAERKTGPGSLVGITQLLGVLLIIISFGLHSPDKSLHPVLSAISLYLLANGVLLYRMWGCCRRRVCEIWHFWWQAVIVSSSVVLAFGSGVVITKSHLVSLHSWLAVLSASLISIQGLMGVVTMRYSVPARLRGEGRPLHVFLGLAFLLSLSATIITGLSHNTSLSSSEGLTATLIRSNLTGIFTIVFSFLICYIILLT